MNFTELQAYIASNKRHAAPFPDNTGKGELAWQVERDELLEHYSGKPTKVLNDAFPNEDKIILDYRKKIAQPTTRGDFLKAVDEIWRLFSSSRYSVQLGNEDFKKWVEGSNWDGMSLVQWVLRVAYAYRVVDANGYLAILPEGNGILNANEKVGIEPKIVSSKNIIAEHKNLLAWAEGEPGVLSNTEAIYYLTDEVYAVDMPSKTTRGERELSLIYEHKAGVLPAIKLGGRTIIEIERGKPVSRQISDFAHALPIMNSLAVLDSQYLSVTLTSCFPHRFIQGIPCKSCAGHGSTSSINDDGTQSTSTCNTCNGSGQVFPVSPLLGYYMNPAPPGVTPEERAAMSTRKPIEFASPDIATIQFLAERRDALKMELSSALDIQRAQNFAQSGLSKEKDRESMYIQIARIADYWFNVMLKGVLEMAQIYWQPVEKLRGEVNVSAPMSFDIKNEGDLLEEFTTLYSGAPAILRYPAFTDYIAKRYANSKGLKRAAMLAVQYAPLSIANEAEKRGQPEVEIKRATYAMPLLLAMLKETNSFKKADGEAMSDEEILAALELRIAKYLVAEKQGALSEGILNELGVV